MLYFRTDTICQILRENHGNPTSRCFSIWEAWGRISQEGLNRPSTKLTDSITKSSAVSRVITTWSDNVKKGYVQVGRDFSVSQHQPCDCLAVIDLIDIIMPRARSQTVVQSVNHTAQAGHSTLELPFGALGKCALNQAVEILMEVALLIREKESPELALEMEGLTSKYFNCIPTQLPDKTLPPPLGNVLNFQAQERKLKEWLANYPMSMHEVGIKHYPCACTPYLADLGLLELKLSAKDSSEHNEILRYFEQTQ